jgi:cbb3-type cytochrome oxidase subunit 3
MLVALELFFVGLLSLATLAIAGVSVTVVYNLFRGQR